MNTLLRYFARAVIYFIALSMLIACTYRDPRIGSENNSTTIKGYYFKFRVVPIYPPVFPEYLQILVDDDERYLIDNLRNTMRYFKYVGPPGRKCVIADVHLFLGSEFPNCPICFTARASETYQVKYYRDYKLDWEELYTPYINIVEESTGKIVAKQDKFCKNWWDCSECNLPEIEKTTGE
jgi:hypothetical protein